MIGRSDEHRTQTTLKRAGCFDDKKYLRCATLVNQVHTWIVSKKFRHEEQPQDTPNNSSMERSLKLLSSLRFGSVNRCTVVGFAELKNVYTHCTSTQLLSEYLGDTYTSAIWDW